MNRLIRKIGHRIGCALPTAGRRYGPPVSAMSATGRVAASATINAAAVEAADDARPIFVGHDDLEMMAKYDPINFGYYVR